MSTFIPSTVPGAIAGVPILPRPGDPQVPSVAIRVRVPEKAVAGRDLTYRILAENVSRAAAHHVTVKVTLPPGARFIRATLEPVEKAPVLSWKLDTLSPGARREIDIVVLPEGMSELSCCARVQFEHGQCVRTRLTNAPRPREAAPPPPPPPEMAPVPPPPAAPTEAPPAVAVLQLRKEGPNRAPRYKVLDFKLVVTNTGKAAAKDVVVEDTLSKGWIFSNSKPATAGDKNPYVWKVGDLAPGASRTIELKAIPEQNGTLSSEAVVTAAGGLQSKSRHEVIIGEPVLAVSMSGPRQRFVGRSANYVLTVSNNGTWQAEDVELTDELPDPKKYPAAITFVRATDGGRLAGNHVLWNLGTLAPGQRRTVLLELRSRQAGKFENVCQVEKHGTTEQASTVTQFEEGAALTVEMDKNRNVVTVGQEAEFTVRLFNGSKVEERNLSVVATLPEGLQALGFDSPGPKIQFPVLARLAPGDERVITIRVRAVKEGKQQLQLGVVSDRSGPDHPVKVEETLTVVAAPAKASK
jgi:uncharacterized repeat protein (TIGR01451 family)